MNKRIMMAFILFSLIGTLQNKETHLQAKSESDYVFNENFDTDQFLPFLSFDSEGTKKSYRVADGKLINSNNTGWTNAIFGNQLAGEYSTLEFELTPHFENEKYSILNFQFRRWDNNTTYKVEITANYMKLYLYRFDLLEKQLLDCVSFGLKNNETSLLKIYTSGWYKSFFVNNQKLLEVSEDKLSTGYFSFETWQTSFEIDNLRLDYVDDKTDLQVISLNNLKKDKITFFHDLYSEEDYNDTNLLLIHEIEENFLLNLENAQTNEEVNQIYDSSYNQVLFIKNQQLQEFKAITLENFNHYVNLEDYDFESQNQIISIINSKTELINQAASFVDIRKVIVDFENEVDHIASLEDNDLTILNQNKQKALDTLVSSYEGENYSEENRLLIENVVKEFKEKLEILETKRLIEKLVIEYIEKIQSVETLSQQDDKTMNEYKQHKILEIQQYPCSNDVYSIKSIKHIEEIIDQYRVLIENATQIEEINELYGECFKHLNEVVKMVDEYQNGYIINEFIDYTFIDDALRVSNIDDFEVVNNALRQLKQAEVDETKLMFGGSNTYWNDFTLKVKIKPVYLNADYSWGKIIFRSQNKENSNGAYIFNYKSNLAWLSKMDDKGKETILDCANIGIENSLFCNVKIVAQDNKIMVFLDDQKVLTCFDDDYKVGAFGFITWQTGYIVNSIQISHEIDENDIVASRFTLHQEIFNFENSSKLPEGVIATRGTSIATDPFDNGNKVLISKLKGYAKTLIGDANYKNFSLKMDFVPLGLEEDEQIIRFIFRANGWENNSYYIELTKYRYTLYACNNGNLKELASEYFEFQYKAKYEVEIRTLEGRIAFYLQGNKMFDVMDPSFGLYGSAFLQMGNVGVQSWNGSYMLDNVSIKTITSWGIEPSQKDFPKNQVIQAIDMELLDDRLTMKMNDTYQIVPLLNPTDADGDYTYFSSNEEVVTVTKTGFVTALKSGDAIITVIEKNSNISKEISIHVAKEKKGCNSSTSAPWIAMNLFVLMISLVMKKRKLENE